DDGDLGAGGLVVSLNVRVHLRDHVLQEEQRAVVDGWKPGPEAPVEPERTVLLLDYLLLILPFDAEGRVGEHVMEAFALEAVTCSTVAERITQDDAAGVLVLEEHVGTADGPGLVVVLLAEEREVGGAVLGEDELLGLRQHPACAAGGIVDGAEDAGFVDVGLARVDEV